MGYWVDGKVDCEVQRCPAYKRMPYRKLEPDYSWRKYSPLRVGRVERKPPTDAQIEAGKRLAAISKENKSKEND